jgi:hypothetical protein
MRLRIVAIAAALWLLPGQPAEVAAQALGTGLTANPRANITQVGTRGANFLRIGPTARTRALADAGAALTGGAASLYYNPSMAALVDHFDVVASVTDMYRTLDLGMRHSFVAVAVPVGAGAIGAHALMFTSGNIEPTREETPQGFDPLLGDFMEWASIAVGASYARRITDRLAFGGTVKLIREGIDFAKAEWTAVDLGTVFETGVYGVRLGMSILHIGGESRFEGAAIHGSVARQHRVDDFKILGSSLEYRLNTETMQLPTTFRLGVEAPLLGTETAALGGPIGIHAVHLLAEVTDGFDSAPETRWGVEYSFRDAFFLRGGKHFIAEDRRPNGNGLDGFSAGAGLKLPLVGRMVHLDYAYAAMGMLGNMQTFTFQFGL